MTSSRYKCIKDYKKENIIQLSVVYAKITKKIAFPFRLPADYESLLAWLGLGQSPTLYQRKALSIYANVFIMFM